jgi:hypothetical protein
MVIWKVEGDVASLAKYKKFCTSKQHESFNGWNEKSEKENTTLTTQRDSTVVSLENLKYNETLVGQNEELSKQWKS